MSTSLIVTICLIIATVCFGLAAIGVEKLNWVPIGLFFLALSFLITNLSG